MLILRAYIKLVLRIVLFSLIHGNRFNVLLQIMQYGMTDSASCIILSKDDIINKPNDFNILNVFNSIVYHLI